MFCAYMAAADYGGEYISGGAEAARDFLIHNTGKRETAGAKGGDMREDLNGLIFSSNRWENGRLQKLTEALNVGSVFRIGVDDTQRALLSPRLPPRLNRRLSFCPQRYAAQHIAEDLNVLLRAGARGSAWRDVSFSHGRFDRLGCPHRGAGLGRHHSSTRWWFPRRDACTADAEKRVFLIMSSKSTSPMPMNPTDNREADLVRGV